MAKMHVPPDFRDFLRLLSSHRVEYLIVGGYAVNYHGYPRTTGDMDVWIARRPENARRLVSALRDFGFGSDLTEEIFLEEERVFRMGLPPVRLEILTDVSGVDFDEAYRRRIVDDLGGVEASLISLPDLKQNKKASGRHKDLDDLERLP